MYIIKNAIKNISRNKGRNILTAVIIFAIILTTAISVIINTTTSMIIEDYKSRFGSEVMISFDESQRVPADQYKPLTTQQQISFGDSELLLSKTLSASLPIVPKGLASLGDSGSEGGGSVGSGSEMEMIDPKAMLTGSDRKDISQDFTDGHRKITGGKIYEKMDECMVSERMQN